MPAQPRPKCQCQSCDADAVWRVPVPAWLDLQGNVRREACDRLMCDWHREQFRSKAKIPGLDKPEGASDFYRPSLSGMIRLADMEIRRQERVVQQRAPILQLEQSARIEAMSPLQRATLFRMREAMRAAREG